MGSFRIFFEAIMKSFFPIHKEGYIFVFIFLMCSIVIGILCSLLFSSSFGFWLGILATSFCAYFFRDPERITLTSSDSLILSPADGVIQSIKKTVLPKEVYEKMSSENTSGSDESKETDEDDKKFYCVSIFLSVMNVHVNRIPISGKIEKLVYVPGKFISANLDKSSDENERQIVSLITSENKKVVFVQIAGLIARRIVCNLEKGQEVRAGERYGLIRFGSRLDIYLPEGVKPIVSEGQTMIGGETILADVSSGNFVDLEFESR